MKKEDKYNTNLIYDIKRKMLIKYPRFGAEVAASQIEFRDDLPFHTAATDGKNVYIDPKYFESLNEEDRMFILAHEIMHIKFMHMYRLTDKDGKIRDRAIWNKATDAIINANLERDGFTIKEGYVNMPEAIQYSAEELYQKLLQEKEKKQQEQNNGEPQEQGNGQNSGKNGYAQKQQNQQENEQSTEKNQENSNEQSKENTQSQQGGDHSLWEEAFKEKSGKANKSEDEKSNDFAKQQNDITKQEDSQADEKQNNEEPIEFDEKAEFEENRKEKRERFKERSKKAQKEIRGEKEETIKLGDIGKSKEEIDWKLLLRREVEKTETIWSQRRSIAENNYAYRLEENDIEDEAQTEVMIDVSGSVDLDLVKAFLRQLKPLLKQSKLRVGCFNEKFWGLVDIKKEKDIDNFTIPNAARGRSAWTEDWDLAVRSFTKKREINKIVFTDGYPCPGTMPKEDLKRENVIWLVYGNEKFKPCCGKVIQITKKQLEQLHQMKKDTDISR